MSVSKMSTYEGPLGIVFGVDGSPASRVAVNWAVRDAELGNRPLTLVYAAPPIATSPLATLLATVLRRPPLYERARRIIGDAVNVATDSPGGGRPPRIASAVVFAKPIAALIALSREAELIVVGSHGRRGLARRLFGSVSAALVSRSHCPVAIIHDEDPLMPDPVHAPVVVAAGDTVAAECATILAREEALRRGVQLVTSQEPASRLVEQSESAQLTVVSGRNNRRSTAATVAQAARMPVIVV